VGAVVACVVVIRFLFAQEVVIIDVVVDVVIDVVVVVVVDVVIDVVILLLSLISDILTERFARSLGVSASTRGFLNLHLLVQYSPCGHSRSWSFSKRMCHFQNVLIFLNLHLLLQYSPYGSFSKRMCHLRCVALHS
jgi:hypothetical protein